MLAVARKSDCCRVLGPGCRAVIWFYGCSKNCEGCIAKTMNNSGIFNEYTPKELYEWVKALKDIEGISISGGEPLEQDLKELIDFLGMVKNDDRKLSIILFTGYTYKEIFDCPTKNAS